MKVLLVEPAYYSGFPPLGLLKLASYHRSRGNQVKLVHGTEDDGSFRPDIVEVTSLFTYAWKPVHEAIEFYHIKYPSAKIRVGGIYASLMPERIKSFYPFTEIHTGLFEKADNYIPAYDILEEVERWKRWDSTILFTSRGCIRNCPFCIVPKLEGKIHSVIDDLKRYIYPGHKRIILWDNNLLASPNWRNILVSLRDIGLPVDFNQGIDGRLVDEEKARMIADLTTPVIRTAFDDLNEKEQISRAIELFSKSGIRKRKIFVYTIYNFYEDKYGGDNPSTFLDRIKLIAEIGCVSYPMRYEPLTSLEKNRFSSPLWTDQQLKMVGKARRILGYGGAFPPYEGLVKKFRKASSFEEAFSVYPAKKKTDTTNLEIEKNLQSISLPPLTS